MSDSYEDIIEGTDHWLKLYIYLMFRIASEGVWIDKDPEFWFEAITNDGITMVAEFYSDSGGGPLHSMKLLVQNDSENLFGITLRFDEVFTNATFSFRALEVYAYMQSYASGVSWYDKAYYEGEDCNETDDEDIISMDLWNKLFGPLEKIDRLPDNALPLVKYKNVELPYSAFNLLSNIQTIPPKEIKFIGGTAKNIKCCKQWALFAILEMRRYYYSSC